MDDQPLTVFALDREALPLRVLQDTLRTADCPVEIGVGIAGAATDAELDSPEWETAFVRWTQPELHEVYLLERDVVGEEEEADAAVQAALQIAGNSPESGGKLITIDHLRRTQTLYQIEILPALLTNEEHLGWAALDVLLRCLAENRDGIIYAEAEGFYDADGEPLLLEETDEEYDDNNEADEEE